MTVPEGFYETTAPEDCSDAAPAFIRGLFMSRDEYNATPFPGSFPRWVLYGGPLPSRATAKEWDTFMFFWATQNNMAWVSLGTPCVVKPPKLAWPYNNFRWSWIRETSQPRTVARDPSTTCPVAGPGGFSYGYPCKYVWV